MDTNQSTYSVPKHDLTALHHNSASRLLIASGHSHLGAQQAFRFSKTLSVPSSSSSDPSRNVLFDEPIGSFLRPPPIGKGQPNNKQLQSLPGSNSTDNKGKQAYPTLSHALPEWYELQNPHCFNCSIPLFLGINASFDPYRGGIICAACTSIQTRGTPDAESKRKLRSLSVRQNLNKKKKGKTDSLTEASNQVRFAQTSISDDTINARKDVEMQILKTDQETKVSPYASVASPSSGAMPISLDAKMKQKKREKKSLLSNETAIPTTEKKTDVSLPSIGHQQSIDAISPSQVPSATFPKSSEEKVSRIGKSTQNSSPTLLANSKDRQQNEKNKKKQALREILAAKKKKLGNDNEKGSKDAGGQSGNLGLQGFLDSL